MQSIADGIGLVFETDQGAIIYSGEFIIDGLFSKIMQIFYDKFANQYCKPRAIIISDDGDFIAYPE